MRRVLVTGAAGFIGQHAIGPLTERGFQVYALLGPDDAPLPGTEPIRSDLHDPGATTRLLAELRPSHLLHLAWYAEPGRFWDADENVRWVGATAYLLHAFAAAGGRRAVFAGTCAEYDWTDGVCREHSTPLAPRTLYGACKLAVAQTLAALAQRADISAAWARVFFLYGPGERPGRLVSDVARGLVAGRPVPCTAGSQRRDFLHVADVASAMVALLDSAVEGSVNIGSGEAVPVSTVVARIAAVVGRPDLLRPGELPTRPDDPSLIVADVSRLRDEVGWTPRFSLEEGIADVVTWHRRHLGGAP